VPKNPREQKRARSLRLPLRRSDNRVDPIPIETADRRPVEERRGRQGAIAQAINGFDVEPGTVHFVVRLNPVMVFKVRHEVLASHGLTGFSAAKLQHAAIDGGAAEIVIKGDDTQCFGARDVERVRDQRDHIVVDIPEFFLQIMQDWQRRARDVPLAIDQRLRQIQIKGRSARHDILPESE
jgi:hypothetical protein